MPTINNTNMTLLDIARRKDQAGNIATVVEMLSRDNPLLGEDVVWREGNLDTGFKVSRREGLPQVTWRRLNEGVIPSKSDVGEYVETCGLMSALSKVDIKALESAGSPSEAAALRAQEDSGFQQAFRNELERAMFYESTRTNPERMMGLSPRFDSVAAWPNNLISSTAGGAPSGADQTSIWLVVWGDNTVFATFPKGTKAGFEMIDRGDQLVRDGNGNEYFAKVSEYNWRVGLVVRDYRYIVRIANVDTSGLSYTGNALIQDMAKALERVQDLNAGRAAFYCNRRVREYLRLQAMDTVKNGTLTMEQVAGKPVVMMGGVPVRRTDALLNTEAIVT